jgi:hypothetical protein
MRSSGDQPHHRRSACIAREADGMADAAAVRQPRRSVTTVAPVPVAAGMEKRVSASRARAPAPDAEADAVVRERYQAFMCTQILLCNLVRVTRWWNPAHAEAAGGGAWSAATASLRERVGSGARSRAPLCAVTGGWARARARWRQRAGCGARVLRLRGTDCAGRIVCARYDRCLSSTSRAAPAWSAAWVRACAATRAAPRSAPRPLRGGVRHKALLQKAHTQR